MTGAKKKKSNFTKLCHILTQQYILLLYEHLVEKNVFYICCEPIKHANFSEH